MNADPQDGDGVDIGMRYIYIQTNNFQRNILR
jgi:hypothetical protein